jgi:4'-phosphopantetheinyl transferase
MSFELPPGTVHLWRVALDELRPHTRELETLLAPDETARAARLRVDRDRRAFVGARAVLRLLLSGYTGMGAAELGFRYGPHGKPALAGAAGLAFNVAHSGALAFYAVARAREVGVDVEPIDDSFPFAEVQARVLTPRERATLRCLAGRERTRAFFVCWTAKEALMKARGDGLAGPLGDADVAALTLVEELVIKDERRRVWTLRRLAPDNAHAAALAVEGVDCALEWRELPPPEWLALAAGGP